MVWRGARDVRVDTVSPFDVIDRPMSDALPRGTGTSRLIAVMERSRDVFAEHEVNRLRRDLGENPATQVWPWCPGIVMPLPSFHARMGLDAHVVAVDAALRGAARLQGAGVTVPEGATGDGSTNLRAKTDAALAALNRADVVFVHIGALAAASHAREFVSKVNALERLDGYVVGTMMRAIESGNLDARLVVIGGPAVSTETGRPLDDPVPFAVLGASHGRHERGAFTEVAARDAGFHVDRAHELLDFLLHLPA